MAIPQGWIKLQSRVHRALYRWTGGRVGARLGAPVLLLTTHGRRSGQPRTTPLFYVTVAEGTDAQGWVVVGSNGGHSRDPHWWTNLKAHPQATVQIGAQVTPVRARALDVSEREAIWQRLVAMFKPYESYRREAGRAIPLVALERV